MTLTIRRTLLAAFTLIALVPCLVLAAMAFTRTRAAMTAQIAVNLDAQAQGLQSAIDKMVFERLENALVWSRSDLMIDLAVGDVDKRVASYLSSLQQGYGDVYDEIRCVDEHGRILASSQASRRVGADAGPKSTDAVQQYSLPQGVVDLGLPATGLEPGAVATISATIPPAADGRRLVLGFALEQIRQLLDRAAGEQRSVVVIDREGRWVAASHGVRAAGLPLADARQQALAVAASGSALVASTPWSAEPQLVGRARSAGVPSFSGTGWTTLVLQPAPAALAPVTHMANSFAVLVALVLVAALIAAHLISARLAQPIQALTARTRQLRLLQDGKAPPAPSNVAEIRELEAAFARMTEDLQSSRAELVRASKLATLGELAAVLAHEVRTPLGIVRSSAQVLRREAQLDADGRELLGFIESETERLNRLVNTLLDSARPRGLRASPCDLHQLLARCAQMARLEWQDGRRAAPQIALDLRAGDPVIELDDEMIMQAVFNLLNNARQALRGHPTGGHIAIGCVDDDEAGGLLVTVADDGPGIAPEVRDRLFEPFVSSHREGFGLGLVVVRQVAQAHDGQVEVADAAPHGTIFRLHLPRTRAARPSAHVKETA